MEMLNLMLLRKLPPPTNSKESNKKCLNFFQQGQVCTLLSYSVSKIPDAAKGILDSKYNWHHLGLPTSLAS